MEFALGHAPAKGGAQPIKDVTTATFEADVIAASMETPVIVDFWAPWCGPCKQLTPVLEKVVTAQRGKVTLAKINTDQNPDLAQALRIQSIPTVYAFFKGRPVDAFQGALPESQVRQFVERLAQQAGGDDDIAAVLEQAQQSLDGGDFENAQALYQAILGEVPETPAAFLGLVRTLIGKDALEDAKGVLAQVPASIAGHADIAAAKAAVALEEQASNAGPIGPLTEAVTRDPADHQARIDLATALFAAGRKQEAIDQLIESIRRDRSWSDAEARKQLVRYFDAMGPLDPMTIAGRRRLSSILFS